MGFERAKTCSITTHGVGNACQSYSADFISSRTHSNSQLAPLGGAAVIQAARLTQPTVRYQATCNAHEWGTLWSQWQGGRAELWSLLKLPGAVPCASGPWCLCMYTPTYTAALTECGSSQARMLPMSAVSLTLCQYLLSVGTNRLRWPPRSGCVPWTPRSACGGSI